MVRRHVARLAGHGVRNNYLHLVWQHYLPAQLYNRAHLAVVSGTLDAGNARGFAWMSKMVARQSALSLELDVFALLSDLT